MKKLIGSIFLFLLFFSVTKGQELPTLNIRIISENDGNNVEIADFEKHIKDEVNTLLTNRKNVVFNAEYCNCGAEKVTQLFNKAFKDANTDIIIGVGPMASAILSKRGSYSKPAIASLVIDHQLQNVPITKENTSGVDNFTYIQSPFSFEKDIKVLHDIFPFKNIGIIQQDNIGDIFPKIGSLFKASSEKSDATYTEIKAGKDGISTFNQIPADVDAIYLLPLFGEFQSSQYRVLFEKLAENKIPSVALFGESMVREGALVGYQTEDNLSKMPRRIALNILKISEGSNAADLPVLMNTYSETVVINMNTVRKVGAYPNWEMVSEAILLNANKPDTDRTLSLQTTIMEALSQNLNLKATEKNPLLAEKEIQLAKADLLPQLDVNTSLFVLDKNTAGNSFATKGRLNWEAGSSLSQVVYAEPILANIAIQELLTKGEEAGLKTTQLDVVIEAAQGFLNVLQAKSFMEIQSANVAVTKSNLDIAKAKEAVGYSGATDLNRWISELALDKIDLNDAQNQFRQSKYNLNQILNHPIKDEFYSENIGLKNDVLMVTDGRLYNKIKNEYELELLGDFLVEEAMTHLPELDEIDFGLNAQKRLLLSQKRAFYQPTVGVSGGLDYTIKRWDVKEITGIGIPDLKPTWNLGLGVSFPILQGGSRKYNQERTELNILQIQDQRANVKNQLELRVRASLRNAAASYFKVERFEEAQKAATENFRIVQDAYSQGVASITSLIDAQNAKVQTEIGAVSASYQFILDFLEVERSIGFYYYLANPSEQDAFFDRLSMYFAKDQ